MFAGFLFFKIGTKESEMEDSPLELTQPELSMDIGSYIDYSEAMLVNTRAKGRSILFFAATNWCQTCSQLEDEIVERIQDVPRDVTILKVDYDNDTAMNNKYGVTTQHTLIVLDSDGKEVTRWVGGGLDNLLEKI